MDSWTSSQTHIFKIANSLKNNENITLKITLFDCVCDILVYYFARIELSEVNFGLI